MILCRPSRPADALGQPGAGRERNSHLAAIHAAARFCQWPRLLPLRAGRVTRLLSAPARPFTICAAGPVLFSAAHRLPAPPNPADGRQSAPHQVLDLTPVPMRDAKRRGSRKPSTEAGTSIIQGKTAVSNRVNNLLVGPYLRSPTHP
jgi:hypothetical protein